MHNHLREAVSTTAQHQTGSTIAAQHDSLATEGTGYVAGIDIGGTNLRVALADMKGNVLAKWSCPTVGARGPDAVIALVNKGVEQLLLKISAPGGALHAVAAGAPGITDVDSGVVIATSYLMGWRDVPFRALLEDALNVPVTVDNDVNLAAVGENWVGAAQGVRDFVFIGIGTGVGASIVLNGSPWRGASWAAGEIGYMLVPGVPEVQGNPGEPGALENMIGGEGIKAQWHDLCCLNSTALPKDLTATQIFDRALAGDALAESILVRSSRVLSRAIYNMNLVLNCPLYVLGGGVGVHPALRSSTEHMLAQMKMRGQPRLTTSALGAEAQLMGALRQALDLAGIRPARFADQTGGKL